LRDFHLYVITGEAYHPGRDLVEVMEEAILGGADIVQLRDKTGTKREVLQKARALRELTRRYGVTVHLGQDDLPLPEARRILGDGKIIGVSTHAIEEARRAAAEGADYIGVGPVFPTNTKANAVPVTTAYVRQVAAEIRIPFVAIGGITLQNVEQVLEAGARRICAVSAIVGSADVRGTCQAFRRLIERYREADRTREGQP
jgi:thiamine-phosphate pyrophosphorylase